MTKQLFAPRSILLGALTVLTLTGCMGSPEPYKPGYQPRPVGKEEDIVAKEMARSVPVHIIREDAYTLRSRKTIGNILRDVSRNPWNTYEWDLVDTLGEPRTRAILGRAPVAKPKTEEELATPQKKGDDDDDDDDGDDDDDDDDDEEFE